LRTASIGVVPPLEPLLDPFELGDFAFGFGFDLDFDELAGLAFFDALGFDAFGFVVALGFEADFGFAAFGFEALGLAFDFDCELDFGFDLRDEAALFDACFFDLVSAMILSPRGVPY
jgi:hypothetical protein